MTGDCTASRRADTRRALGAVDCRDGKSFITSAILATPAFGVYAPAALSGRSDSCPLVPAEGGEELRGFRERRVTRWPPTSVSRYVAIPPARIPPLCRYGRG